MTQPKETQSRDFIADLLAQEGRTGVDALTSAGAAAARASGRARLLAAATHEGRFWRFDTQVAALLDLSRDAARKLLDLIDHPHVWQRPMPGVSLFWVNGGPRMEAALCGFLRVAPGKVFPEHEHLGDETVLVLAGAMLDPTTGTLTRPGELDQRAHGSRHVVAVPEGGVDLLMLAVVHGGLRVNGIDFTPSNVSRHGV
ncbi:MAG: cupin domain-containing protein [Polyangiales bacterium]